MRFWPWFGRLRQILKILKDSYDPRLKSVVFYHWFDMFTDSRLMAVDQKRSISPPKFCQCWFGTLSCSDISCDETQTVFVFQDKLWAELMLDNYSISHKLRRSRPSAHGIHLICCLLNINTGCPTVFMWVYRAAYTILLKYAGIAAVHIRFMIANRLVLRSMQFAVTERVW